MFEQERYYFPKEKRKERFKLIDKLKLETYNLMKEIAPIDENLRIDIERYENIYGKEEIIKDKQKINEFKLNKIENKEKNINPEETFEEEPYVTLGETLEVIKTYLFNEFKSNKFICVRTSEYDDYFNHVDNLIINKETGDIICATDVTVEDVKSSRVQAKNYYVLRWNTIGGSRIKYSVKIEKDKESIKIVPSKYDIIPQILIIFTRKSLYETENFLERYLDDKTKEIKKDFNEYLFNFSNFFDDIKVNIEFFLIPSLKEKKEEILQKSTIEIMKQLFPEGLKKLIHETLIESTSEVINQLNNETTKQLLTEATKQLNCVIEQQLSPEILQQLASYIPKGLKSNDKIKQLLSQNTIEKFAHKINEQFFANETAQQLPKDLQELIPQLIPEILNQLISKLFERLSPENLANEIQSVIDKITNFKDSLIEKNKNTSQ